MSSICGIVDLNSNTLDFERLRKMAKALTLRGRSGSHAYIKDGVGLHTNMTEVSSACTLTRPNGNITVIFDGKLHNSQELASRLSLPESTDHTELLAHAYIAFGVHTPSYLDGDFSFAIYDERSKELFMARDKRGAKPLFYTTDSSSLVFASEIKALLCATPSCLEVEIYALSELITSDSDTPLTADLYTNVNELPEGCFAYYSRLGLQISAYEPYKCGRAFESKKSIILPPPSLSILLDKALMLSLFAFDRPAFDEYIPSYISAIENKTGEVFIEDPVLMQNESFALEKADRLGALCGVSVTPTETEESPPISEAELNSIEKKLSDKVGELFSYDSNIKRLLGAELYCRIERNRDLSVRIRSLGMTLQSELWLCHYPIITR